MIPSMGKHVLSVSASSVLSALILLSGATAPAAQEAIDSAEIIAAELDTAEPRFSPVGREVPGRPASESFRQNILNMRDAVAGRPENEPFGTILAPPAAPLPMPPSTESTSPSQVIEELDLRLESPEVLLEAFPPGDLVVALNRLNTVAPSTGFISTLGEPAHANVGQGVFYTGNTFASFSPNAGLTWAERAFPAPLNTGDVVCCDQDIEYSQGRDHLFWSLLYINPAQTAGVITIAVLPSPDAAPACLYDFTFPANVIPDYPHLGLSNDFLYLNVNNINTQGTTNQADDTWVGSQMFRFPLDEMAACQNFGFSIFTWLGPQGAGPQRVFVPVEGATDVMYWGILDNNTTFRIFEWPESPPNSISSFPKTISMSAHANPDCRGGTNNVDWIQRPTSFSITGFRMRGWVGQPNGGGGRQVVGWLWNASPTGGFLQAHIRAAVFDTQSKDLTGEPHIFNNNFCFGYPDVAITERGHPAIVLGVGGRSGGGGFAVSSAVLLGDDLKVGAAPFGPFTTVAAGTHNPANNRFGDYFTMQQLEPCDLYMTASSYVFNGGTAAANVEHHYVIFGRNRDRACFDRWNTPPRVPLPRIPRLPTVIFGP